MSAPAASLNADDDGPEEGEIEDDDDDIIIVEGNTKAPVPSHFPHVSSATSTKVHQSRSSAASKDSYERDIRNFELRKNRATRSRRTSGSTKSPHSSRKDDTRTKSKYSRTGLTQGKENRHAHRHKSPSYRHRNGSHDRTLADCKDVSPIRRDSSCSSDESVERDIRSPAGRSSSRSHHRLAPSGRPRSKRKASSSPDSVHTPSKRKSHSSEKCPLMKVLRSVARETRLINNTMEHTETSLESSSSLRQRLLNMGAMSEGNEEQLSASSKNQSSCISTTINEKDSTTGKVMAEDNKELAPCDTLQTTEILEESNDQIREKLNSENDTSLSKSSNVDGVVSPVSSESSVKILECIENDCLASESTNITCSPPPICENLCGGDDDDDDDISQLRLLALQSKKHEPPPPADDADVLELRLAALKTAFMKKFKIRKKNTVRSIANLSKEDPLSSVDDLPLPLCPGSPEEAMTPVDMELAETDDEATSEHSMDCYSPSDPIHDYFPSDPNPEHLPSLFSLPEPYSPSRPTGSPSREPSLQELLPPPPPPDLDLYLSEPEPNPESCDTQIDNSHEGYFLDYLPSAGILEPPPLPSFFRDLLSDTSDLPTIPPQDGETNSNLKEINLVPGSSIESEITFAPEIISTSESSCESALPKLPESEDVVKLNHSESTSDALIISAVESTSKSLPETKENESTEILVNLSSRVETKQSAVPLEEEEKLLRQRLLLNMANKKNNALISKNMTKDQSSTVNKKPLETSLKTISSKGRGIVLDVKQKSKTDEVKNNLKPPLQLQSAKSKPVSQVVSGPNSGDENRLIISLEDDSDSCEDYSEAEALGTTCAKNREKWLLQMKELEVSLPKTLGSAVKTASVVAIKVSPRTNLKNRQPVKESSPLKPFAENLADLENSVEQFLKGVRRSHEAVSKTKRGIANVSSATPVAVKHLPPRQQEEYRRLKQQIATLERQRLMAIQKQKKALQSSEEQQKRNVSAGEHPKNTTPMVQEQPRKSIPTTTGKLKKNSIPSKEQPHKNIPISNVKLKKTGSLPEVVPSKTVSLSKGILKTVPNSSVSSRPEISPSISSDAASKINSTNAQTSGSQVIGISKIDKGPNQTNLLPVKSVKPNAPFIRKEDLKQKIQGNQNVVGTVNAIGNIPSQKTHGILNVKKAAPLQTKPAETRTSLDAESQSYLSLSNLETTVIKERSNVLNELSALSKLLSQVEKSIVAQSNTATEVSSLLEKLCLAAGRWKAQDKTVTGLVQRVAQRQKELSLRHQSCIHASTSCMKLGLASNKGAYRVPVDKADAMRLQLKLVHEKTQDLAKRRTAERARKNVLEKRAGDCLQKLFNDSKRVNIAAVNSPKVSALGTASHSKALTKESKLETAQAPMSQVKQPTLNTQSSSELPKPSSLFNPSATSTETQSSSTLTLNISPKVNSAVSARAVNKRLALNKVKSAKAVLKLAQTKHRIQKSRNGHCKRMYLKSRTDEDSKHDLSDMEISTEDEEADIKGKGVSGNLDVVDMSVSPDTSLSPLDTERVVVSLPNEQDCTIQVISTDAGPESSSERWKLPVPRSVSISPMEDPIASNGEQRQFSKPSGKGVLKDYVSPLGGLSVFSNTVREVPKQGDLYAILCPYELNGKCEDTECAFKHQNDSENK